MQIINLKRKLSQIYLILVPVWISILGFAVGYISYKIYLPVWIINVALMITSSWILGLYVIKTRDLQKKHFAIAAFFLIVPYLLISMFFGLGPPPDTISDWVTTATEQEIRYIMLIIAGVFIALGFSLLREKLRNTEGSFYSMIGFTAIMIAIPLFISNMIFWSAYLPGLFKYMASSGLQKSPEWFHPIRDEFNLLTVVEVAISYLAIAAFSVSLRTAGWFSKTTSLIYIVVSLTAFAITILPFSNQLLPIPFFIVTIPAIPFLMPYFIGISILKQVGN